MRFPRIPVLAAYFLIAFSLRGELPKKPAFTYEVSDLKADPQVRYGQLSNGLRYAVLANHEPKQRASFRLLVLAGAAQETDAQRGLAHFIEHMAFKGTTHYPPGTLIEYFQRLGMSFGGDTNANTSFERTVYLLELPNTEVKTITDACAVFADYARGERLIPREIESERGVILSEKRDRDSVEYRRGVMLDQFLLSHTRIPERVTIGSAEVISHAPAKVFRAYYDQWYRPERMAVVAVGDFDPAQVEKAIREQLSEIKNVTPAHPDPSLGSIPMLDSDRALYRHEPEAGATYVDVAAVEPYIKELDTKARRLRDLPRDLALNMLNRRLAILARNADAPFLKARAEIDEQLDFYRLTGLQLVCKPEQWNHALDSGEAELHRALQYGFTASELKQAIANRRHEFEEAVKTSPTRRSRSLADHLISSLLTDHVFTSPEEDLALYAPALDKMTLEDCLSALRAAFHSSHQYVAVLGNLDLDIPTNPPPARTLSPEQQILIAFRIAEGAPVKPAAETDDEPFAYASFGPPGKVQAKNQIDDLDTELLTFSNGVRLNVKKTDFEANRIHLMVRIGAGSLTEPKNEPGLSLFTDQVFVQGGVGRHSFDDLIRLAAGHSIGLSFKVDRDALVFSGTTNREDLLFQLQILTAYLTDAAYRPEALAVARKSFEPTYQKLEHTPEGLLQLKVRAELASGDSRFGVPPKEDLLARTLEETRAWLEPQLKRGPIEVAIVGDLDLDATVTAVAQTFGALGSREAKPPLLAERTVHYPDKPLDEKLTVATTIPRGLVALFWPTTDAREVKLSRRTHLLANVFADRLRAEVRTKLGDAYSPSAQNISSETYPGYGFLMAYIEVDPLKTDVVAAAVLKIANDLATQGVTEEELIRAKTPVLTSLRETARTNAYWLGTVLDSAQEHPEHLDWSRTRYDDFGAITKADLDALAKEYLPLHRVSKIVVVPK